MTKKRGSLSYSTCAHCNKPIRSGQEHLANLGWAAGNVYIHRRCGPKVERRGGRWIGEAQS